MAVASAATASSRITHATLQALLAALVESGGQWIADLPQMQISDPQLVADADQLIHEAIAASNDEWEAFLPLVSACSASALIRSLGVGDMWMRQAAAMQCGTRQIQQARPALIALANAGDAQDCRAARASVAQLNRQ
jgi:hypothetical protein